MRFSCVLASRRWRRVALRALTSGGTAITPRHRKRGGAIGTAEVAQQLQAAEDAQDARAKSEKSRCPKKSRRRRRTRALPRIEGASTATSGAQRAAARREDIVCGVLSCE